MSDHDRQQREDSLHGPLALPKAKVQRTAYRRLVFRRLFYLQLVKIVALKIRRREAADAVFVSRMGGIGDLVNLFPTLECLSRHSSVEMGTGPTPYRLVALSHPALRRVYSPFVYKSTRDRHRRIIERVLTPFYKRVILLDDDRGLWTTGKHISEVFADRCGVPAPTKGVVYLSEKNRRDASDLLLRYRLSEFVYVAQVIRRSRPHRSWPRAYYHELYRMLRDRFAKAILVDTLGSDETAVPDFCLHMEQLDVLTAAAVIERARLFIGPDSGLTHIAAAVRVPTVSIHLGYPPAYCRALGDNVAVVTQRRAFDDPRLTLPEEVLAAVAGVLR